MGDVKSDFSGNTSCHINCRNPYDLRLAADAIVAEALKRLEFMPSDQPLVILMGEHHAMPAHSALQQLVAKRLAETGEQFTAAFEYHNNEWTGITEYYAGVEVPADLRYNIHARDPLGRSTLSSFLGYDGSPVSPVSVFNLRAYYYHKYVPTIFNDVARNPDGSLDFEDPNTRAAAQEYLGQDYKDSKRFAADNDEDAPKLTAIRNSTMARLGVQHAKLLNARIIMQQTGMSHVFGDKEGLPYAESLCAAFSSEGAVVLPVFIPMTSEDYGLEQLPEQAATALADAIVICGLSEEKFYRGQERAESEHIKTLNENSGGEIELRNVSGNLQQYRECAHADTSALLNMTSHMP